jgi:hypothetical protein
MNHPAKIRKAACVHQSGSAKWGKKRPKVFYLAQDLAKPFHPSSILYKL